MRLAGSLALVTGAASGIGRATALALAARDARLVICDLDDERLQAVRRELGEACVLARQVDVGDRAAMARFAEEVHSLAPALDVLVNNAGVGLSGGLLETSLDDWDWVLRVNVLGVVHGCHYFVPPMVGRRRGHVVNTASILSYVAAPGILGYVTSKFAVLGLTLSLRGELRRYGVGVTAVCPGIIATDILGKTRFADGDSGMRDRLEGWFRWRAYPPERVAEAVCAAVEKNRALVPVTPESWAGYVATRLSPTVAGGWGRDLLDYFKGLSRASTAAPDPAPPRR